MAATKVPVTITFRRPGTQPPVFVAGSFSEPQWQPQEMTGALGEQGEYEFKAEILADPGSRIEYKFRIGHGDWWLLDEEADSAVDDSGNRNSVLVVPNEIRPELEEDPTPESSQAPASPRQDEHEPAPEIRLPDEDIKGDRSSSFGDLENASGWPDPFSKTQKSPMDDALDDGQDRVPLFAHECLVSTDDNSNGGGSRPHSPSESRHSLGFEHEPDVSELQDPELEQFPSRIEQISELIHEVEGELEEDETTFEGVPPSAVLGVPRRKTNDFVGDFIGGSPTTSPSLPRPSTRLAVPRASAGSVASDVSSSALSLQSIAEGGEDDDDAPHLSPPPVVRVPSPVHHPTAVVKAPTSEDDEAVVLDSSPKRTRAEAPATALPKDDEETSVAPPSKDVCDNSTETPQKSQEDWLAYDGESQPLMGKSRDMGAPGVSTPTLKEKEAIGNNTRQLKVAGGSKELDWQTLIAVGGAAVAVLGLAIWLKGH